MIAAIEWQLTVGLLGGVGMIVLGIASSHGSFRRWDPWYRDSAMPWFLRNGAFALVPFAIGVVGLVVAALASSRSHAVAWIGVVVFLVGFAVGLVFMIRPPDRVKPAWAREYDGSPHAG